MVDPARKIHKGKMVEGIYGAHIAGAIARWARELGYATHWVRVDNPCQRDERDVFCQTWSLYLQAAFISNSFEGTGIIHIPKDDDERYAILAELYRSFFKDNEHFCAIFNAEFTRIIKENKSSISSKYYKTLSRTREPCKHIQKLTAQSLQ